jgi:hypothetical protein
MAKTATQRQREHVARLRRKAQAFDLLTIQLNALLNLRPASATVDPLNPIEAIRFVVREAELAVQE